MTMGIYRLYNKVTGRSYVGKSKNIEARIKAHFREMKKGWSETHKRMWQDFDAHGPDSFAYEILEECSVDQLDDREGYWAYKFDVFNPEKGYNTDRWHMPSYDKYVELHKTPEQKQEERERTIYNVYHLMTIGSDGVPGSPESLARHFCLSSFSYGGNTSDFAYQVRVIDKHLKKEGYQSPIDLQVLEQIEPLLNEYQELKSQLQNLTAKLNKEICRMVGLTDKAQSDKAS